MVTAVERRYIFELSCPKLKLRKIKLISLLEKLNYIRFFTINFSLDLIFFTVEALRCYILQEYFKI